MFFWGHPVKTARWRMRMLLVVCAFALLNISTGYSLMRSIKTGEIHHVQLFGGIMPVLQENHAHHLKQDYILVASQFQSHNQAVTTITQAVKVILSEPSYLPEVLPQLKLQKQVFPLPNDPYLALPPKPPKGKR